MFRFRESFHDDVGQILEVAKHLDTVNLPARPKHLERIVAHSVRSFSGAIPPLEREYLFVVEDVEARRVVGTSLIHAQHGTRRSPHVYFRVIEDERYSETLDRYMVHQCLQLGYDHNGPTEVGGLILLPEYRSHVEQLGKTLSYARFLFIAMNRASFRDRVLSELMPPLEEDGTSRLWKHLGRRFTGLSYEEADLLSKDNKEFIRTLFPHSRIYTSLFPDAVKEVVGVVGPETIGVEKILRRIGFDFAGTIDPFDGGPHMIAKTDEITLVRDAREVTARAVETADSSRPRAIVGVANGGAPHFCATATRVVPSPEGDVVGLPKNVLAMLGLGDGDSFWLTFA